MQSYRRARFTFRPISGVVYHLLWQTVWVNCHKRNSGPVNFIVESCLPLSCTNQFCARKLESGVLKMVQQINTDFCLEHSVRKRHNDFLLRWSVAPVNFFIGTTRKAVYHSFFYRISLKLFVNGRQPCLLPCETEWDGKK